MENMANIAENGQKLACLSEIKTKIELSSTTTHLSFSNDEVLKQKNSLVSGPKTLFFKFQGVNIAKDL